MLHLSNSNLLYHWHSALSERNTAWTELIFEEVLGTEDFKSVGRMAIPAGSCLIPLLQITEDQFQDALATKLCPDPDVRKWTFDAYVCSFSFASIVSLKYWLHNKRDRKSTRLNSSH